MRPALGRPLVDRIHGSRHHNMKELLPPSTGTSDTPPTPKITRALRLLLAELNTTPPRIPGDRRPVTYKICECRCGAPGWRTTRLGAGDRGVTRTRSGRFGVPLFDLSVVVAGTGLAHQLA